MQKLLCGGEILLKKSLLYFIYIIIHKHTEKQLDFANYNLY